VSETEAVQITDASGLSFSAWLKPTAGSENNEVLLQLADGTKFLIPWDLLSLQDDGNYLLSVNLREYAQRTEPSDPLGQDEADTVIRLAEEVLRVNKRTVERDRVRITKRVVEREETVDLPLLHEEIAVERIPINKVVEQAAPVRYDGDTTIIPLYEEVLVFSKQLMLVEEVHVTRRQTERHEPQRVTLRREEAEVERLETEPDAERP
jgi:uncharacterized protein (TIGR02271 family)